jgi:hypothetical protein
MFQSHGEGGTITIHFTPTRQKRSYWTFKLTAPIRTLRAMNRAITLPTSKTNRAAKTLGGNPYKKSAYNDQRGDGSRYQARRSIHRRPLGQ